MVRTYERDELTERHLHYVDRKDRKKPVPMQKWPKAKPMALRFRIYGIPVPCKAPKFTKRGITYKDKKERAWMAQVRSNVELAMAQNGKHIPCDGPVIVRMTFYLPRAKARKGEYHIIRPDADNLCKAVLDSIKGNRGIFRDDSQVFNLSVIKQFVPDQGKCGVEIECYQV